MSDLEQAVERLAQNLATEIMVKVRQAKIDCYSDDEHQDEFEALTLVPLICQALSIDEEKIAQTLWHSAPSNLAGCFRMWHEADEKDKTAFRLMARAVKAVIVGGGRS